jgi:hypothetical protein
MSGWESGNQNGLNYQKAGKGFPRGGNSVWEMRTIRIKFGDSKREYEIEIKKSPI